MDKIDYRAMARNLCIRGIRGYKQQFMQNVDILNGEQKRKILEEADSIIENIKADDRAKLIAERDMYKRLVMELESKLNSICSLEDCDEEFEL